MKTLILFLVFLVSHGYCSEEVNSFLKKYPYTPYQDIKVNQQVIATGTDLCEERYHLINPILNSFKKPFKVLDLGAAQGYFSFTIAEEYPESRILMIDANTDYYSNHGNMLLDLCHLNRHLDNICYINKKMMIDDLKFLNQEEHFDLVLALLVVHLMGNNLNDQVKIIENLLKLGNHLIIEIANDVGIALNGYIEHLVKKFNAQYLGEVSRHRNAFCPYTNNGRAKVCPCKGTLYLFQSKKPKRTEISQMAIKESTFQRLKE